jgi:transcriptional regulator of heat shock response
MPRKSKVDKDTQLTSRQKAILFAVIKEYCDFGRSLGSKELKNKYHFDFSSATIRNELVALREKGFLFQPFTNSSSKPSEKSFKLFISQLLLGLQVTQKQHENLKKQIFDLEQKQANLTKEISRLLAYNAGGVGFSVNHQSEVFSGISNLLEAPAEGKVSEILNFLDNLDNYKQFLLESSEQMIEQEDTKQSPEVLRTFIGQENPVLPLGRGYAMVTTDVYLKEEDQKAVVGLITPVHLLGNKKKLELVKALSKILGKKEESEE